MSSRFHYALQFAQTLVACFFPSCVFLRESCTILEICVCSAFHALVNSKLFDAIEYLCMCVNVRERAFFSCLVFRLLFRFLFSQLIIMDF